jgi:DNA-binding winged helix-turn-helix (wHTH) protein
VTLISFPPFRLDLAAERLWRGRDEVALRRKPLAILRYLIANPRRLVTHDELLAAVWGGAAISESAMRSQVHDLRRALGEGVIETVVGRGYRFVAAVADVGPDPAPGPVVVPAADASGGAGVVGRDASLAVLAAALDRACAGHRGLCFVTGDPGIGKTTLVDTFVAGARARGVAAAAGHCVEQYGTPEAYLAVIELLGELARSAHGDAVIAALVRFAPAFLTRVPHLVPDAVLADVARRGTGAPESRIARELIEVLEAVSETVPLVLVLEDLQWSDVATIDLVSLLGQRTTPARLLVIATTRRAEAQTPSHPLNRVVRGLVSRGGAVAVPLVGIERADLGAYLAHRFAGHAFDPGLVDAVAAITGGTPLFVVSFVDDLVARGMIAERGGRWILTASLDDVAAHRPESVRQLLDIQLDRLAPAEQRALEAASVIGAEFSTALVAAALELSPIDVDDLCDGLVRRGLFLHRAGSEVWPDNTAATRYRVGHALVQEVCFARTAPARRQRWHRLVAEALERGYGDHAAEVAHVLATHFEHGERIERAMHYYVVAGERTAARFSNRDAARLFARAYALLDRLGESPAHDPLELRILEGTTQAVIVLAGEGSRQVSVERFERMITIARRLGDPETLYGAIAHLCFRYATLAQYDRAAALDPELDAIAAAHAIAPNRREYVAFVRALRGMWTGDIEPALPLMDQQLRSVLPTVGLGVLGWTNRISMMAMFASLVRYCRGEVDTAIGLAEHAIDSAIGAGDPYMRGGAQLGLARVRLFRGDPPARVLEAATPVLAIPEAEIWYAQANLVIGAARSREAPLAAAELDELVGWFRARTGSFPMGATVLGLPLVEALRRSGDPRAPAIVDELIGFARAHGEHLLEAELVRQRGELIEAAGADPGAAAACYREAIGIARPRGLHLFTLRAATRLAALAPDAGARAELAAALAVVTEGAATPDVVAARAALAAL